MTVIYFIWFLYDESVSPTFLLFSVMFEMSSLCDMHTHTHTQAHTSLHMYNMV